jgi:23S rRNA (pseudouridine1915-N3)-methyltransferase
MVRARGRPTARGRPNEFGPTGLRIRLVAAGARMPDWVAAGLVDYAKRFPRELPLELEEVRAAGRSRGGDVKRALAAEGERMLDRAGGARVVALDVGGRLLDSEGLAAELTRWRREARDVAILIGGPQGLAPACLERAELKWSLSPLTLPHQLVRIVVAEQLYRALTILQGHPYHRS